MRKMIGFLSLSLFLIFSCTVFAETGPQVMTPVLPGQEAICEGPPGGTLRSPAAVDSMLIQDLLQAMMDSLELQERVLKGPSPEEKKQVQKEIGSLRAKLERLRSEARVMMKAGQPSLCDEKRQ